MAKNGFVGRDALAALAPSGGPDRLACLVLDYPGRWPSATSRSSTKGKGVVGRVSSGGLGYSLGLSIAYAWLPAERAEAGSRLSVEVFGETVGAEVRPDPLYDASGERLRS